MKITRIDTKSLAIPLKTTFKHASAERCVTETILVMAYSKDIVGYGEGCPRSYVTGENIESCINFIKSYYQDIIKLDSVEAIKQFIHVNQAVIDVNPAAWCAIEIAILDLLGKVDNKSIESMLNIPEIHDNFYYTAVLGISNPQVFNAQLSEYIQLGFTDYKLKLSGDIEVDSANIASISAALPHAKIRLDANNLWDDANQAISYLQDIPQHFWAIEEPIKVRNYNMIKTLTNQMNYQIILDESFLQISDLNYLSDDYRAWIPNIRISKMGGLLRSLAIMQECRKLGVKLIMGAQVGETSILTRAAISLANSHRDILLAQEGAFGTHLLEYDIIVSPVMFGKLGALILTPSNISGLGLKFSFPKH